MIITNLPRIYLFGALLLTGTLRHAQPAPVLITAQSEAKHITEARAALLLGVNEAVAPGLPGVISVFGPRAFPVMVGTPGGDKAVVAPSVAAAFTPKAGIVAFGHDGFLDPKAWNTGQTKQLLLNSLRWTQRGKNGPVGIWTGNDNTALVELFSAAGINATAVKSGDNLAKFSALVVNG
ncbi:MAG: hypothetical protein EOO05_15500, partial [Chitinophagaceae bacterium]